MVWLLRLGLGAVPRRGGETAAMAWEEVVMTRELNAREMDYAMRATADVMVEAALKMARQIDPVIVKFGDRYDASFTGLARVFQNGVKTEVRAGPGDFECDNQGVAIAAGRAGVIAGIARLRQLAGHAMTRQFSQTRRVEM